VQLDFRYDDGGDGDGDDDDGHHRNMLECNFHSCTVQQLDTIKVFF
jgi:hypothetical protein